MGRSIPPPPPPSYYASSGTTDYNRYVFQSSGTPSESKYTVSKCPCCGASEIWGNECKYCGSWFGGYRQPKRKPAIDLDQVIKTQPMMMYDSKESFLIKWIKNIFK